MVLASEVDPPAGIKPVQWRLLTHRRITTLEQAGELIDWYRARWEIEILFNTLKNGCRIETLQLDSIEKLQRAIALFVAVSWRIGWLMRTARHQPDTDAAIAFDEQEIRVAYVLHRKKPPPRARINEVLRLVAMLGGFLGRKGDAEPGVKTIWLGLQELRISVLAIEAYKAAMDGG